MKSEHINSNEIVIKIVNERSITSLLQYLNNTQAGLEEFGALSDRVRFLKSEREGEKEMCDKVQRLIDGANEEKDRIIRAQKKALEKQKAEREKAEIERNKAETRADEAVNRMVNSIRNVMNNIGCSVEKAMDTMGIPEESRVYYREMLSRE